MIPTFGFSVLIVVILTLLWAEGTENGPPAVVLFSVKIELAERDASQRNPDPGAALGPVDVRMLHGGALIAHGEGGFLAGDDYLEAVPLMADQVGNAFREEREEQGEREGFGSFSAFLLGCAGAGLAGLDERQDGGGRFS